MHVAINFRNSRRFEENQCYKKQCHEKEDFAGKVKSWLSGREKNAGLVFSHRSLRISKLLKSSLSGLPWWRSG